MATDHSPILVIEDDESLLQMIKEMLELEGYCVITSTSGSAGIGAFDNNNPLLILMDIGLPDMDGISVCRCIRRFSKVPIIMVTGNTEIKQKIEGLYAGADDYIAKPFLFPELLARINAVLRRTNDYESNKSKPVFRHHDLMIDFSRQTVRLRNEKVELSNTEYRILAYLAQCYGQVVVPAELLKAIWGDEYVNANHLLQVNISRLRQKLKDNARDFQYIETRPGQGYTLTG